jgi:hypothetical protein
MDQIHLVSLPMATSSLLSGFSLSQDFVGFSFCLCLQVLGPHHH